MHSSIIHTNWFMLYTSLIAFGRVWISKVVGIDERKALGIGLLWAVWKPAWVVDTLKSLFTLLAHSDVGWCLLFENVNRVASKVVLSKIMINAHSDVGWCLLFDNVVNVVDRVASKVALSRIMIWGLVVEVIELIHSID